MTRKDYEAIATRMNKLLWIHETYNETHEAYHDDLCEALGDVFAADNERFDRKRFLKACRLTPGWEQRADAHS